jgi:hypothetical protein
MNGKISRLTLDLQVEDQISHASGPVSLNGRPICDGRLLKRLIVAIPGNRLLFSALDTNRLAQKSGDVWGHVM